MKQNTFFTDLVNKSLIDEWAKNIDWLLNDDKFNQWQKNEKRKFTKIIKDYLSKNDIEFKKIRISDFNVIKAPEYNYIYINGNSSDSIDIIRHIRNGIAHGHCRIIKNRNKVLYLMIIDYTSKQDISAKINIPIALISQIRDFYKKIINFK